MYSTYAFEDRHTDTYPSWTKAISKEQHINGYWNTQQINYQLSKHIHSYSIEHPFICVKSLERKKLPK